MPLVVIRKPGCWEAHVEISNMSANSGLVRERLTKLGMAPVMESGVVVVIADDAWSPPGRRGR